MYKKLINFIKYNMQPNSEQFSMRIPKDLKVLLEKKSKKERLALPEYVRTIMVISVITEVLESELKQEACEWITKQGKDSIEIHFGKKIKKLEEIIELASYAIEETEKLQQKFMEAEVEYINEINSRLH